MNKFFTEKFQNLRDRLFKFYNRTADYMLAVLLKLEVNYDKIPVETFMKELAGVELDLREMENEPWRFSGPVVIAEEDEYEIKE